MRKYFATFLIILFFPLLAQAEKINAGFVSGVWYSRSPFFAGDDIRIYSAIQNQSDFDIVGKIEFYDKQNLIGSSDFSVISGRLIEGWVDWKVTAGNHSVYVRIAEAKKSEVGGQEEEVELQFTTSSMDELVVDLDTDGDRIGNQDDEDDDGDSISDEEELAQGTDPLNKDLKLEEKNGDTENLNKGNIFSQKSDSQITQDLDKKASPSQKAEIIKNNFQTYVVKPAVKAVNIISRETKKITNVLTKKLEQEKNKVEIKTVQIDEALSEQIEEVSQDKNLGQSKSLLDKIFFYFLSVLLYILNIWWLTLIVVFILLRILWRIVRRFMQFR